MQFNWFCWLWCEHFTAFPHPTFCYPFCVKVFANSSGLTFRKSNYNSLSLDASINFNTLATIHSIYQKVRYNMSEAPIHLPFEKWTNWLTNFESVVCFTFFLFFSLVRFGSVLVLTTIKCMPLCHDRKCKFCEMSKHLNQFKTWRIDVNP